MCLQKTEVIFNSGIHTKLQGYWKQAPRAVLAPENLGFEGAIVEIAERATF